jgi:hypothetical protein
VPPLRRPAASISSSDLQQPFHEAARDVETWAQTTGESSARDAPAPTTSAVALRVEAGDIVMRLKNTTCLMGPSPKAHALPGPAQRMSEADWTEKWFRANGPIINGLLALTATAQSHTSPSSPSSSSPASSSSSSVRRPLKLVEISAAAQHGRAPLWHLVQPDLVLFAGE